MERTIKDQVAIVTGGASGIGLATAVRLSTEGAKVALFDTNEEGLQKAKATLVGEVIVLQTDVSSEESVQASVSQVLDTFGQIDIAVNAAGIVGQTNTKIVDIPVPDFQKVFEVNLMGSFILAKTLLPHMVERNYGRILLIASIAGKEGNAGMVSYSTTKAGVIGLVKTIGKEYAETGITINSLAPAVIKTPIHDDIPQEQIDYMTSKIPMKRCGTLDEIVSTIRFIVSPENSYTTGFCFDLSGGRATY